ncbi:MAG TPA: hypothetical protein VLB47_03415 [Solirubrobacteraceae bacterium]|nr:hypothetical protein [Solirubrobacteraceae bacterium]
MPGLDDRIAQLGQGSSPWLALVVALLLGLRHATDPDHLTAMATLVASDDDRGRRRAGILGLAWGAGHATTLFACGLPIVLFRSALPDAVVRAAEAGIGIVIVLLALRLLRRWRRGTLHVHVHRHGDVVHAHPHVHEPAPPGAHPLVHEHAHGESLGRSPLTAFSVGLVHGIGGSAGVGVLLVGAVSGRLAGAAALTLFAAATALSMSLLSAGFAQALVRGPLAPRMERALPVMGAASLLFGCWYALSAI